MDGLGHSEYANYLLDLYEAGQTGLGSGISAMPSVHVGLVVLNALFLSSLNRWLGVVGWAFAAMIFYGSVYTGWHCAVDGYVATAVALAIWWLTGRLIHQKPHSP
ncbi:phosphatase PAP2 family protein [Rhizobium mongolense]|uniref:phosphatase PAP2 family protein n=1 Tax=Rhizobium mongolense TaxID=57676 RepID=UPI0034A2B9D0